MHTVLAGHGLTKKYGSATALAGMDIEVGKRDSPAIMGPSGSGRSTLLHTLAGIIRPDGGQVLLGDERIDKLGENRLSALRRKRLGSSSSSANCCRSCPPRPRTR
jgi:putative ABC transport system ATP-binding protein